MYGTASTDIDEMVELDQFVNSFGKLYNLMRELNGKSSAPKHTHAVTY